MDEILVSISCITYNHEPYIADAIESFLMQKTNFKYEILIHDDASTDRTAEIIKKYQKKYPDIIKPIYQTKNQYSKGVKRIGTRFNESRARGKYIAICEGDDYWTDPYKLQKQVDLLERNDDVVASFHRVEEVTPEKKRLNTFVEVPYVNQENLYDIKDIIRFDGKKIHVSSLMYKKEFFSDKNIPKFYYNSIVGDLAIMLSLSLNGHFLYINESMSCTRRGVEKGASERLFKSKEAYISTNKRIIETYREFDKYTNYNYSEEVKKIIDERLFNIKRMDYNLEEIKKLNYYKTNKLSFKFKTILYCKYPEMYNRLAMLKNKLRAKKINNG